MRSGTQNRRLPGNRKNFGRTEPLQVRRSTFDLSKKWKGTFDAGLLVPFYVSEALPGDSRRIRIAAIIRLATPIKPVFDNIFFDFHFWSVPNRQLWDNFVRMMGEQDNPGDSTDYLVPQVSVDATGDVFGGDVNSLADYMGLPPRAAPHVTSSYTVSALPARAYNRIYNFHYRDQNLQPSIPQKTGDATDPSSDYIVRRRGKRHDYLTASLPFQQKGDPVNMPLGTLAPVIANVDDPVPGFRGATGETATRNMTIVGTDVNVSAGGGTGTIEWETGFKGVTDNPQTGLVTDLSQALAPTITDLRQAIAFQHVLERDARSGSRYPEILFSRYQVMDPQMLVLQRPEYLGGGTQRLTVAPIPQTTEQVDSGTPQGNLAAVGVTMVNGIGFNRSFTEFSTLIGIVSARADLTYQQGVERMWSRRSRFDFYHPELAHISEQAVAMREIYVTGDTPTDTGVWGYVGQYDDYRYSMSHITGLFRTGAASGLDVWHLAQWFENPPALGPTFIEENPPIDRIIATQDEPHFIADFWIEDIAARPLPVNAIPGLSRI